MLLVRLENTAAIVITLGEVSGPLVLSNMQFLALIRSQATGATSKGGNTVEHTGFLTQDRDRVVTGPWPSEKMLRCWGLVYSCWLLSETSPTPFTAGRCSVTNSWFVLFEILLVHQQGWHQTQFWFFFFPTAPLVISLWT